MSRDPSKQAVSGRRRARRRIALIRWTAVAIYILVTVLISFLPLLCRMDPVWYSVLTLVVMMGGLGGLVAVLFHFEQREARGDERSRRARDAGIRVGYREHIPLWFMYYFTVPFLGMYTILILLLSDMTVRLIMILSALFFVMITALFSRLSLSCTPDVVSFGFGPLKKTIPVEHVRTIRSERIHWLRDYMGQGIRRGPDGAWGYIAGGSRGVRIRMNSGKEYVVSTKRPKYVVEQVRAARDARLQR